MMAPNIVAMNAVSATKVSQASALSQTARQVSAAIGVAIIASVFASARPDGPAGSADLGPYRVVFHVAAGLLVVATIVAQFVPGKAKALQLQADRKAEMEALGLDPAADEPAALVEA